jgi:hypothetical protein
VRIGTPNVSLACALKVGSTWINGPSHTYAVTYEPWMKFQPVIGYMPPSIDWPFHSLGPLHHSAFTGSRFRSLSSDFSPFHSHFPSFTLIKCIERSFFFKRKIRNWSHPASSFFSSFVHDLNWTGGLRSKKRLNLLFDLLTAVCWHFNEKVSW